MVTTVLAGREDFLNKLKGPISKKDLEVTNEFLLYPRKLENVIQNAWFISEAEKDKPLFFRYYQKHGDSIYGISLKASDACAEPDVGCLTFTNATKRRVEIEIPLEVIDRAIVSVNYAIGQLGLTSSPDKSEILIDGVTTGKLTPETLELSVGTHMIEVRHADFEDTSEEVKIIEGVKTELDIILPFQV